MGPTKKAALNDNMWHTSSTQVDCTAAFTHAPIPKPVGYDKMSPEDQQKHDTYVELPRGFKQNHPGCVLKLKKNLYGSKSAPRNWFHHLRDNLDNSHKHTGNN